jgi:hypothetical protein
MSDAPRTTGSSFRLSRPHDGPPRSVVGPGVLAAAFAVLLTLAGSPAHLGPAAPGLTTAPTPGVAHVTRPAAHHAGGRRPVTHARPAPLARSVLLREDCDH